jgi:hypothetical protein
VLFTSDTDITGALKTECTQGKIDFFAEEGASVFQQSEKETTER